MANTRDTIGDQATVDGLVNRTLTSLEEDGVLSIGRYALYNNTALESVNLPSATTINQYAFGNCTALEEVALPKVTSIAANAFNGCSNLEKVDCGVNSSATTITFGAFASCPKMNALILRGSSMSTLSASDGLSGTAIQDGFGAVYVPTSLISTYKANSNWSPYMIADINDYPVTSFGVITDSWAEIKAAESNGTYLTKYSVGDTKVVYINGVGYMARIIGFDLDTAANSGDSAHITWMLKTLLNDTHNMNSPSTTSGGWEASGMRSYLSTSILPNLDCKDYIVPVIKTYYDFGTASTKSCTDSVWIPSYREVVATSGAETSGCDYTAVFNSSNARIMKRSDPLIYWWLRSAISGSGFWYIGSNGSPRGGDAYNSFGVALGFCT